MEPESSLPRLQVPTTYPYPKPDQSSPFSPPHFLKINLNVILHLRSGYPSGHFPSGFLASLLSPYVLYAQFISFFSILWPE
jgi:hypothetical protein